MIYENDKQYIQADGSGSSCPCKNRSGLVVCHMEMLFNASREALKKLMNLLMENKRNGMVRNINKRPAHTITNGVLCGHKQTAIDNNDIRIICDC